MSRWRDLRRRLATAAVLLATVFVAQAQKTVKRTIEAADTAAETRMWGNLEYRGVPWVTRLSEPVKITHGLQGRHLSLWASHGRYYDTNKGIWKWQRPRLYCTSEDIFTQSFVVPFLMPMLERAGAIVFTPRERDWQRHEVVVDNDHSTGHSAYIEKDGALEWETAGTGFAHTQDLYFDNENPFEAGTCRRVEAQVQKRNTASATWQPQLPEAGEYAVYVSYASLPTSVSDALYTVRHQGISTQFRVNQQMGGGTWVYLGTFYFDKGAPADNCVTLSNHSNHRGCVTADAVRFGGGMGQVARGDSLHVPTRSQMPRALEASRYYAQWAGMPYPLYKNKQTVNDYAEDINTRSLMTNLLARGSTYLPGDSGRAVPLELSLAIHSDAGFREDSTLVGTLGVVTTGLLSEGTFEGLVAEGRLPSGRSRMMSLDLCNTVMSQVCADITQHHGAWNRRVIYDRNYSETRVPELPSMILETLSHQNFADMLKGHDPVFKFLLSRAIYKGLLQYVSQTHNCGPLETQPLPVKSLSALVTETGDSVRLSWQPTADKTDYSATPTGYIVYVSQGKTGWDNGTRVFTPNVTLPIKHNTLYRFKVCAFNEGGLSLDSEELCAYSPQHPTASMLIVNDFTRLAGPQPIDTDSLRGFDIDADPGLVYRRSYSYCGRQRTFQKCDTTKTDVPRLIGYQGIDELELGYSTDELEGMLIVGNTFDFPTQHATDFLLTDSTLRISSTSVAAFEQGVAKQHYHVLDLIVGAQRNDGYSTHALPAFSPLLMQQIRSLASRGTSLLVSGAYLSEELPRDFALEVLHCEPRTPYPITAEGTTLTGMNTQFAIFNAPNEEQYAVRRLSTLAPTPGAFCAAASTADATSLAVAHQSAQGKTLTFGFPLECITQVGIRRSVMGGVLNFLKPTK